MRLTLVEIGSEPDGLEQLHQLLEHVAQGDDVHSPLPTVELDERNEGKEGRGGQLRFARAENRKAENRTKYSKRLTEWLASSL